MGCLICAVTQYVFFFFIPLIHLKILHRDTQELMMCFAVIMKAYNFSSVSCWLVHSRVALTLVISNAKIKGFTFILSLYMHSD